MTSIRRPIVISIHGILTHGKWQKVLTATLNSSGFDHHPLDYGFFHAVQLLWPRSRARQVIWFRDEYTRISREAPGARLVVIAHSFGTYLVTKALELFPELVFDRVILCGSIVRVSYPWTSVIHERKQVQAVLNDYGHRDLWAGVVGWVVEDAGPSGVRGFDDEASGAVSQRGHPQFKHSDFFYRLNYERNWIPFLDGAAVSQLPALLNAPVNWRFRAMTVVAFSIVALTLGLTGQRIWSSPVVLPAIAKAPQMPEAEPLPRERIPFNEASITVIPVRPWGVSSPAAPVVSLPPAPEEAPVKQEAPLTVGNSGKQPNPLESEADKLSRLRKEASSAINRLIGNRTVAERVLRNVFGFTIQQLQRLRTTQAVLQELRLRTASPDVSARELEDVLKMVGDGA